MERKLVLMYLIVLLVAFGLAAGALYAQASATPVKTANDVAAKPVGLFETADIALRVATLFVLSGGLMGTFALFTSLRANAYSQIYGRFQTMLLKLADHPELFDRLKKEEYSDAENDPNHPGATQPHRFIANAMVNLYEEAYLLHRSRVLSIIATVPQDYWQSMLGSMRAAFQLRYVRTHWERRQAVFSSGFNNFVREQIIGYTGVNPAPDVA
ncbi:hypothetical protein BH11PLA2_BH11PLA2_06610 [soil metagenome]